MNEKIKNEKIIKYEMIAWKTAHWLQPKKFKSRLRSDINRLKNSLLKNDFIMPFFVSEKIEEDKIFILDGHGRKEALNELSSEGHSVPDSLPALFLDVKTKEEAFKTLLLFNSNYGMITRSGLKDVLSELDLKEQEIKNEVHLVEILDDLVQDTGDDLKDYEISNKKLNVLITFGIFNLSIYKFKVDREIYDEWINGVRKEIGLLEEDIIKEFKRRLGLKENDSSTL